VAFIKNHPMVFTLIRPAATFSLREKESKSRRFADLPLPRERVGERESTKNCNVLQQFDKPPK
jgi:hypothetical protein